MQICLEQKGPALLSLSHDCLNDRYCTVQVKGIIVTPTHLFVPLGSLNTHTIRLIAFVALWTGHAVETWVSVDATLCSTHFVANIRHHVTLEKRMTKCISKNLYN